jgi:uncharacterized protein (TIGR00730 family)
VERCAESSGAGDEMPLNLCVCCSSSDVIEPVYFEAAKELGTALASRGDVLIYGGTNMGLMGTVARSAHQQGGRVVGIIPGFMATRGLAYAPADELILTRDMRERKALMESRSDAFIGLPGGFGTLEEMLEMITLKQLQQHTKPIVFLNIAGFYDPLAELFRHVHTHRFAKSYADSLYHFSPTIADAFSYLDSYEAPRLELKWFRTNEP